MNSIPLAPPHSGPIPEDHTPTWLAFAGAGLMIVVAGVCVPWLPGWAADYGAILVYWALALHLAIAIGLARWAVRARRTDYRGERHRTRNGYRR